MNIRNMKSNIVIKSNEKNRYKTYIAFYICTPLTNSKNAVVFLEKFGKSKRSIVRSKIILDCFKNEIYNKKEEK